MKIRAVVLVLLVTAGVWNLRAVMSAQGLGSIAKQEEERRKTIKDPSKVLTNQDLPTVPPPSESAAPAADAAKPEASADGDKASGEAASATDKDAAAKPAAAKDAASDGPKDQAYWSGRMKALEASLERDQTFADALQTRINVLSADFVNRDDPVQRTAIGNDRQKALDELARLNKQITDDRKAISDLQEEARRAGVPAGWLR
jgi:hypothetical protein